ncbi:MAG: T9SS type A sorting domain-containing protein [Chitinophagaceae bacterium]
MINVYYSTKIFGQVINLHQDTSFTIHHNCGIDLISQGTYTAQQSTNFGPEAVITAYGSANILQCGHIAFYFEDQLNSTGFGFDDPINGTDRRNTLCSVANYIQGILDFTSIPLNDPVKIEIQSSYGSVSNPTPTNWSNVLAAAIPEFGINTTAPGYYGGQFFEKVNNYPNYNTTGFDAYIRYNYAQPINSDNTIPLPHCEYDLFTITLHEMLHAMGWFSMLERATNNTPQHSSGILASNPNAFSKMDEHFYFHGDIYNPASFQKYVTGPSNSPAINSILQNTANCMIDNMTYSHNSGRFMDNNPVYGGQYSLFASIGQVLHHMDEQHLAEFGKYWITPGFTPRYIMGPSIVAGIAKRDITLQEIRMLIEMGYGLDPIYAASTGTGLTDNWGNILNSNHKPESLTDLNPNYFSPFLTFSGWAERINPLPQDNVVVDAVLTNNNTSLSPNTSQLIMDLNSMPSKISDADNDFISIIPATIVGIRGMGDGGNNHNRLQLNPSNSIVTYTPSPNFIGLAQFYAQLWDGKEAGAIALFTIDVQAGNNIAGYTMGDQKVINGSFEEGTEHKTQFNQNIQGNQSEGFLYSKEYFRGYLFSDGHPFSYFGDGFWSNTISGIQSRLASKTCSQPGLPFMFGSLNNHFPSFGLISKPLGNNATSPNDRYSKFPITNNINNLHSNFSELLTPVHPGEFFELSFDLYIPQDLNTNFFDIDVRFTNQAHPLNPNYNYTFNFPISVSTNNWIHITQHFYYCGTTPSTIIELVPNYDGFATLWPMAFIDNISLIEKVPQSLSVLATATPNPLCLGQSTQLTAQATPINCTMQYNWLPTTGLSSPSIANPLATPTISTTYTITVTDASTNQTATASVLVNVVNFSGSVMANSSVNPLCLGSPLTLFGSGAVSYAWSGGVTDNVPFTPAILGTTTYTVTGTDANGCTAISTINSTVIPSPVVGITSSPLAPVNICAGAVVTLSGTGASTYSWSGGINNALPFTPTATTTYTVTGTNANGCSNTSSVTITVNPPPVVSATAMPSSICTSGTTTLTAMGANSYTWQPGNIIGNNIVVSPTTTTTYTVTGTTGTCTGTATIMVTVLPPTSTACCANLGSNVPVINSYASLIANFPPNSNNEISTSNTILLDGTILIPQNLTFAACPNILLGPNAEIIVGANTTLSILDASTLKAACPTMWNGITVSNTNAKLITNSNCHFQNMINGIYVSGTGQLWASNAFFEDNYVSIQLSNLPSNYSGLIHNSQFNTTANTNLLAPFNNQSRGEHGILIANCPQITIGGTASQRNHFENLYNGIYIRESLSTSGTSTITTSYNTFKNIKGGFELWDQLPMGTANNPAPGLNGYSRGNAILGTNTAPNKTTELIHIGNNSNTLLDFDDCQRAIMLTSFGTHISNTKSTTIGAGFMHYKCENQIQYVHNNSIQNTYLGIALYGNGNQGSGINYNTISLIEPPTFPIVSSTNSNITSKGIDFNYYVNAPNFALVKGNTISSDANLRTYGINFTNMGMGYIQENSINFTSTPPNVINSTYPTLRGVHISNSFLYKGTFSNNNVAGTYSSNAGNLNSKSCGVYVNKSSNVHFICNSFNKLREGMYVVGDCSPPISSNTSSSALEGFKGNMFNPQNQTSTNMNLGIMFRHLGSSGTLGQIGDLNADNHNTFGPLSAYGFSTGTGNKKIYSMCGGNLQQYSYIYTNPNQLSNSEVGSSATNCGYVAYPNNTTHYQFNCSTGTYNQVTGFPTQKAFDIAQDLVQYPEYNEVAEWMDERELYQQLSEDENLMNNNALLEQFYDDMQNDPARQLVETDQELMAIFADMISNGMTPLEYQNALNQAQASNNAIISTAQYETNERAINDLYIAYLRDGFEAFTEQEAQLIQNLAMQCPYIGGIAVYKARSLYALYNPMLAYEDMDICNAAGVYKGAKGLFDDENAMLDTLGQGNINKFIDDLFKIYPNPASTSVTVEYSLQSEASILQLFDLTGRIVKEITLPKGTSKTEFRVTDLVTGVYTYKQILHDRSAKTGKLLIE